MSELHCHYRFIIDRYGLKQAAALEIDTLYYVAIIDCLTAVCHRSNNDSNPRNNKFSKKKK